MSKYELKTKINNKSVTDFLNQIQNETRRQDAFVLNDLFREITKQEAKMWGSSIIGFGKYSYKTKSGIEADFMQIGFSPRKQNLSLHLLCGFQEYDKTGKTKEFLKNLGKHKVSKSCLYINKLADINIEALKKLLKFAWENAPS